MAVEVDANESSEAVARLSNSTSGGTPETINAGQISGLVFSRWIVSSRVSRRGTREEFAEDAREDVREGSAVFGEDGREDVALGLVNRFRIEERSLLDILGGPVHEPFELSSCDSPEDEKVDSGRRAVEASRRVLGTPPPC